MKPIAIIPAREGSKRLPGKNWKTIGGRALIEWAVQHALDSRVFLDIVVTTDSSMGIRWPVDVPVSLHTIRRPAELAADNTPMMPVVKHAVEAAISIGCEFDTVVLLQPTSPLRTGEDICAVLELMGGPSDEPPACDSVVSVCRTAQPEVYDLGHAGRLRLVRAEGAGSRFVVPNGAVYAISVEALKAGYGFEDAPLAYGYEMPASRSVDINDIGDFEQARAIMEEKP